MITISIDDQIEIGNEIVRIMKKLDPEGEHYAFQDADDAFDLIEEKIPDVCWLDVEMPGRTGLEVSLDIKLMSPKTNIIFVTGHEKFAYPSYKLHPSGFLLKPVTEAALKKELENLRFPVRREREGALLRIRCFGEFEVFDKTGNPVKFTRKKSKELLACLVDRRGDLCETDDFCRLLFGEQEVEKKQKNQIRVFLKDLKGDLKKVGAQDVIIKEWNANRLDCKKVDCDYFDLLREDVYAVNAFQGEYMSQYPWAELSLGELGMGYGDH